MTRNAYVTSFSVMEACRLKGRTFLGCDING